MLENPRFTLALSIASVVVSIAGLFFATEANRIAGEANRIARKGQAPRLSIQYLFSVRDYLDDYKYPCQTSSGEIWWTIEFAAAFDVSNLGDTPVSLVDIREGNRGVIETFCQSVTASVVYRFFRTAEGLESWLEGRSSPTTSFIRESTVEFELSEPPIDISAGETTRMLLWGRESARIDPDLTPAQVHHALLDVSWGSDLVFVFADGATRQLRVPLIHPYEWQPSEVQFKPFEPCWPRR